MLTVPWQSFQTNWVQLNCINMEVGKFHKQYTVLTSARSQSTISQPGLWCIPKCCNSRCKLAGAAPSSQLAEEISEEASKIKYEVRRSCLTHGS
jgi:hypothetical protein